MNEPIPSAATTHALTELFREADQAVGSGASTQDFEPAFAALLNYILANVDCHEAARMICVNGVRGSMSWELLCYLMHELRWENIKQAALRRIHDAEDWRIKNPMADIVAAFDDDWEDADMYHRWR